MTKKRTTIFLLLLLAACSYFFFFHNLGGYSLKEPDEGRYAEIPREMVESGDFIVPHLNYVRYFEKPPLLYWLTAVSYKIFGINEWSFRLPNALVALACVVILYFSASRWFGRRIATLSSFILMSSFGFWVMARGVTTDMLLSFLLFAALICFYEYYRGRKQRFLYLFFAALALAVLTKGPVSVVLLLGTILLFLFFEGRLSFIREMFSVKGILLFLAIGVPWFVAVCVREKQFFQFFFIDQNIMRFLTSKHKRSGPIYYFIPVLLGGMFPWSLFLPRAVVRLWRYQGLRLFLIWSAVVFVFFSLSGSKLPPYILPLYPALALVLGCLFGELRQQSIDFLREPLFYAFVFAVLAVAGIGLGSRLFTGIVTSNQDMADLLASIRGFALAMGISSVIVAVSLCFRQYRTFDRILYSFGGFSLVTIMTLMCYTGVIDGLTTTKDIAHTIKADSRKEIVVINYGAFDETLPFYLGRRIYLADFTGELAMGASYKDAKKYFLDQEEFKRIVENDQPVFIVTKMKRLPILKQMGIDTSQILARHDKRVLVANSSALRH
jgi:4-amino-4-deoxy-L-arabinose transferase-like glycosyltransferase